MQGGMRQARGRHAAGRKGCRRPPSTHSASSRLDVTVIGAALIAYMLIAAATAIARAATWGWGRLGPAGRWITLMVLSWPLGEAAGDVKAVPGDLAGTGAASGVILAAGLCGLGWLRWKHSRGQERWRETSGRGFPVIEGSLRAAAHNCDERFTRNSARLDDLEARADEQDIRMDEQDVKIEAIFNALAGQAGVPGLPGTRPHLTLVRPSGRSSQGA